MPILWSRPSAAALDGLLAGAVGASLTYPEQAATAGQLPANYIKGRRSVTLGSGTATWEAARAALRAWKAHTDAGVEVTPAGAPLEPGTAVVVSTRLGLLWMAGPCRIVYVTDTPERYGFAYGTLPGHPESGEEAFHVVCDAGGRVSFEVVVFYRPVALLARLGGPLSRAVQRRATSRYLAAMTRAVGDGGERKPPARRRPG